MAEYSFIIRISYMEMSVALADIEGRITLAAKEAVNVFEYPASMILRLNVEHLLYSEVERKEYFFACSEMSKGRTSYSSLLRCR